MKKEMLRHAGIYLLVIAVRVYCVVFNNFGHRLTSVINPSMWTTKLLETLLNLEQNEPANLVDEVLKVDGALGLCFGTLLFSFPNQSIKNTSGATKADTLTHIYVNTHGMALILTGSNLTSVGFGMDAQKAFGYNALLASVLQLVKVFIIDDVSNVKDVDENKRKTQFCIRSCIFALHALINLIQ